MKHGKRRTKWKLGKGVFRHTKHFSRSLQKWSFESHWIQNETEDKGKTFFIMCDFKKLDFAKTFCVLVCFLQCRAWAMSANLCVVLTSLVRLICFGRLIRDAALAMSAMLPYRFICIWLNPKGSCVKCRFFGLKIFHKGRAFANAPQVEMDAQETWSQGV